MKYGDTLRQRSIPEWGHFNIDYDYLKDLIKHQTTPGAGKAVSIPGQGETTERAFGDTFFRVLKAQHDRINLFIKSKSGEIERRLDHISKQTLQIQARQAYPGPGVRLPAKTIERYAKIDADVTKAGEEIRSLSRFRTAQRTGFHKILKKYKRWTKDAELEHHFKRDVIGSPDSFFQLDLGYLLDQYIDALSAVRAPFASSGGAGPSLETTNSLSASVNGDPNQPSHASRLYKAIEEGFEVDFDMALSTIPLGARGGKATYWIHPDHVLEAEVFLVQYLRLHASSRARTTPHDAPYATPARRKSSSTHTTFGNFANEDDTGFIVLDQPESFAKKQNASTIGSTEEATGVLRARASGSARWTSTGEAAAVVGLESNQDVKDSAVKVAKLKRKYLETFLDPSASFDIRRPPNTSAASSEHEDIREEQSLDNIAEVRQWLVENEEVRPIAGACSKRTRFLGFHNGLSGGLWATLDRDIFMKRSLIQNLKSNEWVSEAHTDAYNFPHAVLEIRREGNQSNELIQALDRSHLVERVRGFSLEAHAVWTCCRPNAMLEPLWIPTLQKDIRKLPAPMKRRPKKAGSVTDSLSNTTPPRTSTSTTSVTDGQMSPEALYLDTSATSGPELLQPSIQNFRKKPRRPYADYSTPVVQPEGPAPRQGYWNEYDNPESEDDGYYIYMDPNASVKFPGQEMIENWARKTRDLFSIDRIPEESPLLSGPEYVSSDEDETADESTGNYGAISPGSGYQLHGGEGYFSNLFRSLRHPHRDAQAIDSMRRRSERERQDLLSEIHIRQHKREMTKLRFYTTCLVAAVAIDVLLGTLTVTSRRKERGPVDAAILFGTISNLLLLIIAILSMRTRHERLGWVHQGIVFAVAIGVVVVDVLLLRWMLSP